MPWHQGLTKRGREDPPIQLTKVTFLQGANLHFERSALVAVLRCGPEEMAALGTEPPADLGYLAGCDALDGGTEVVELLESARRDLAKNADGWALALAIAERAQTDYCMVPARGRLLALDDDGTAQLLVPGENLAVARGALDLGVSLILWMHGLGGRGKAEKAITARRQFVRRAFKRSLDMLTLAVARRAIENDIPVYRIVAPRSLVQLGQGRHASLVAETVVGPQLRLAEFLTRDKAATLVRLSDLGLPVLRSSSANSADSAVAAAREIGGPVVIKPVDGGKGVGISLNLTEEAHIRQAYAIAARRGPRVVVEAYADGVDHRVTVVDGRMIAAAKRVPATVTGDGRQTVRQLIDELNRDPRRGSMPYEKLMERVPIDARLEVLLGQQGLALNAVPAAGRMVKVSLAANISQGGTAIDVTDQVHPDNRQAIEMAARVSHALVAGVDFFTPDISRSWREGVGWILEINLSPGLRPHWIANPEQDLVTPILRLAFPEGAPSRVPSAGITGSMGKTTTCQMLAQIARVAGRHPALSTTQGTWSGTMRVKQNDWAGGRAATALLGDPAVDISIAELARGGLLKRGMTFDGTDVVAVLNLSDNHVGIDGIESREDLAAIKAIPVRVARKWVFLYADEPLVLAMREQMKPGVRLGLVSPDPASAALAAHRREGGCTVTREGKGKAAAIVVREGEDVAFKMKLSAIPAMDESASPAIAENAMFAAAIALKLGLAGEDIAKGLGTFASDEQQNPGRHNRIEGFPFELVLSWVDGVPSLEELLARLEKEAQPAGRRHLYLTVPGNRSDAWSIAMGRTAAGHFDHYWCSDMFDRRGRPVGEMAALLAQGLREGGVPEDAITMLAGKERAIPGVLAQIAPGDHITLIVYETTRGQVEIEAFRKRRETA